MMEQSSRRSHAMEAARLKKALALQQKFNLLIAEFTHYSYRNRLIKEIDDNFKSSVILEFTKGAFTDFVEFENRLTVLGKTFSLIHLINREKGFYRDIFPLFFKGLNYHREKIARENPVSIIIWMLPGDVRDFALIAPDMWAWRSGVFDFRLPVPSLTTPLVSDAGAGNISGKKEKIEFRVDEITAYLIANPNEDKNLRKFLFHELGELYYTLTEYDKAEEFLLKALDIYKAQGDPVKIYRLYKLLEVVYILSNNEEKALGAAGKAGHLFNKLPPGERLRLDELAKDL